jgi:hypothetical protein
MHTIIVWLNIYISNYVTFIKIKFYYSKKNKDFFLINWQFKLIHKTIKKILTMVYLQVT